MVICDLPHPERGRICRQQVEICLFGQHMVLPERGDLGCPLRRAGGFEQQPVHGMLGLLRHLDGQHAAVVQQPEHLRQDGLMVGQPLHAGVGEHEVVPLGDVRQAVCGIELDECERRMGPAGVRQHIRRVVRADDVRLRKMLGQHGSAVADAAADVEHGLWLDVHRPHKVVRGQGTVFFKFAVQRSVPVGHKNHLSNRLEIGEWRVESGESVRCSGFRVLIGKLFTLNSPLFFTVSHISSRLSNPCIRRCSFGVRSGKIA